MRGAVNCATREARELDGLDPRTRSGALAIIEQMAAQGHRVTVAWQGGRRTVEQQAALADAGASRARGPQAPHVRGAAVDFAFMADGWYTVPATGDLRWALLGAAIERQGMRWGGRFGESAPGAGDGWDKPHAELRAPAPAAVA